MKFGKPKHKAVDVWIDSNGDVRILQEIDKHHWLMAKIKPFYLRETKEHGNP